MKKSEPAINIRTTGDIVFDELLRISGEILIIRDDVSEIKKNCDHLRYTALPELNNKLDLILKLLEKK